MESLKYQFSAQREPNMELRLFQLVCLAAVFLVFAVIIPMNYLQNLSWLVNAVIAVFGLLSLTLYWASLHGHHFILSFFVLVSVVLDLCWFTDAGSQGSLAMFFFVGVMVNAIFFRGRRRLWLMGLFIVNVLVLLTLDYLHPNWSGPFNTPFDRYLDLITGFMVSVVTCILMLWVVLANHDEERKRLSEANQALRQSLDEIRTLQGLLPICSWCKKIRNDEGLWTQLEQYIGQHTEASFTHGMCPECAKDQFHQPKQDHPIES